MVLIEEKLKDNYIHRVYDNGIETWTLYNEKGSLLHNKFSNGRETWQSYNTAGFLIYAKDKYLNGETFEQWWEVDDLGHIIWFKNSNGYTLDFRD